MKGKNRLVPRLLGVTKDSVLRLDEKTKEILKTWPLTTVRRWAASPNVFTLDFGDYQDQYYSVQVTYLPTYFIVNNIAMIFAIAIIMLSPIFYYLYWFFCYYLFIPQTDNWRWTNFATHCRLHWYHSEKKNEKRTSRGWRQWGRSYGRGYRYSWKSHHHGWSSWRSHQKTRHLKSSQARCFEKQWRYDLEKLWPLKYIIY